MHISFWRVFGFDPSASTTCSPPTTPRLRRIFTLRTLLPLYSKGVASYSPAVARLASYPWVKEQRIRSTPNGVASAEFSQTIERIKFDWLRKFRNPFRVKQEQTTRCPRVASIRSQPWARLRNSFGVRSSQRASVNTHRTSVRTAFCPCFFEFPTPSPNARCRWRRASGRRRWVESKHPPKRNVHRTSLCAMQADPRLRRIFTAAVFDS